MKALLLTAMIIGVLSGCISSYTCEGDHKEVYWNISPTTNDSSAEPTKPKP